MAFCRYLILLIAVTAPPGLTAQTLDGRIIEIQVITYDDPDAPMLESSLYSAEIGEGWEFGLTREGRHAFLDIVPVFVDIGDGYLHFSYEAVTWESEFTEAVFNGYVITIGPCVGLSEPVIVEAVGLDVTPEDITAARNVLRINVAGRKYGPDSRLTLGFDIAPCPVS